MRLAFALLALLAPLAAAAQGDPRVRTVDYEPDRIVVLQLAPGYVTAIEFAPDERVESVAVGSPNAFRADPGKRGDRLYLQALTAYESSNLLVATNVRHYSFTLTAGPDAAYVVRFRYPATAAAEAADAPAPAKGRYKVSGDRAIQPSGIDDDGVRTYITWPADATLPAVYALDAKGNEALVNGMMRDDIFVIDDVAPRLVFRLDRQVARATRIAAGEAD